MAITSQHPLYTEFASDWELVEDTQKGERHVKAKGVKYLPPTSGMLNDGMGTNAGGKNKLGQERYEAYKLRAKFPALVKSTVRNLLGMMHRKPATIEVPERMKPLIDKATDEGESLQTLLRKINEAQLYFGRLGLLGDVPNGDVNVLPYITFFNAKNIINWDTSPREDGRDRLDFVVIDESEPVRDGFDWRNEQIYRLLDRDPTGTFRVRMVKISSNDGDQAGLDTSAQTEPGQEADPNDDSAILPTIGGRSTPEIPFIFIGSNDTTSDPDEIPMLDLALLSLTIYRGEADYRQSLFMQGQDTLVIKGRVLTDEEDADGEERQVGAGSLINVSADGDAKFIGVTSDGLAEQREALQNDKNDSRDLGSSLISSGEGGGKEAEGTVRIRVGSKTASLMSVAKTGAEGLENFLKTMAEWMGLNPEEVSVTPNLDFVQDQIAPKDLLDMSNAKSQGFPLANETLHKFAKDHDMTAMDFEEEMKLIEKEREEEEERQPMPTIPPVMVDEQGNPLPLQGQQPFGNQNPDDDDDNEDEDDE